MLNPGGIRLPMAAALCGAALLTACTGSDTSPSAGTAGSSEASAAGEPNAVSAKDLCDYLRGRLPTLNAIGSEEGALANLTTNLYSWYEKHGVVPSGSQIDGQLQRECPDVQTEILALAGMKSFATL